MADGSERFIAATLGKECRLDDRAVALFHAAVTGELLRSNNVLDRELGWLIEAVEVIEPDGHSLFKNTKLFIEVLRNLEGQFERGTLLWDGRRFTA